MPIKLPKVSADRAALVAFCKTQLRSNVESAWAVGHVLRRVKATKDYGEWGPFLEEVGLKQSTASRYIKLAICYPSADQLPGELTEAYVAAGILPKSALNKIFDDAEPQQQRPGAPENNNSKDTPSHVMSRVKGLASQMDALVKGWDSHREAYKADAAKLVEALTALGKQVNALLKLARIDVPKPDKQAS